MNPKELRPLEWRAFEFEEVVRPPDWYVAVAIVTITLAVTSFLMGNGLFGIVIIVSSIALVLNAVKKPRELDYVINKTGVVVGPFSYSYGELSSFWIREEDMTLLIKPKKITSTLITLPIADVPLEAVRQFLLLFLTEEEILEPLSQKIMERIGF